MSYNLQLSDKALSNGEIVTLDEWKDPRAVSRAFELSDERSISQPSTPFSVCFVSREMMHALGGVLLSKGHGKIEAKCHTSLDKMVEKMVVSAVANSNRDMVTFSVSFVTTSSKTESQPEDDGLPGGEQDGKTLQYTKSTKDLKESISKLRKTLVLEISPVGSTIVEEHNLVGHVGTTAATSTPATTTKFYVNGARLLVQIVAWSMVQTPVPIMSQAVYALIPPRLTFEEAQTILQAMKLSILLPLEYESIEFPTPYKGRVVYMEYLQALANDMDTVKSFGVAHLHPASSRENTLMQGYVQEPRQDADSPPLPAAARISAHVDTNGVADDDDDGQELGPDGCPKASVHPVGSLISRHGSCVPDGNKCILFMNTRMPRLYSRQRASKVLLAAYAAAHFRTLDTNVKWMNRDSDCDRDTITHFLEDVESDVMHSIADLVEQAIRVHVAPNQYMSTTAFSNVGNEAANTFVSAMADADVMSENVTVEHTTVEYTNVRMWGRSNCRLYCVDLGGLFPCSGEPYRPVLSRDVRYLDKRMDSGAKLTSMKDPYNMKVFAFCRQGCSKPFAMTGRRRPFREYVDESVKQRHEADNLVHQYASMSKQAMLDNLLKHLDGQSADPTHAARAHMAPSRRDNSTSSRLPCSTSGRDYGGTTNVRSEFARKLCIIHELCGMFPEKLLQHRRTLRHILLIQYECKFWQQGSRITSQDVCFMTQIIGVTTKDYNPYWWMLPYL